MASSISPGWFKVLTSWAISFMDMFLKFIACSAAQGSNKSARQEGQYHPQKN
jgi:hypothetical protein